MSAPAPLAPPTRLPSSEAHVRTGIKPKSALTESENGIPLRYGKGKLGDEQDNENANKCDCGWKIYRLLWLCELGEVKLGPSMVRMNERIVPLYLSSKNTFHFRRRRRLLFRSVEGLINGAAKHIFECKTVCNDNDDTFRVWRRLERRQQRGHHMARERSAIMRFWWF